MLLKKLKKMYNAIRENIRTRKLNRKKLIDVRFLEDKKIEWEYEGEDGLTMVETEDYKPYVPGSYTSLPFTDREYYFDLLSFLPHQSTSKITIPWVHEVGNDICNLIDDFSKFIFKFSYDNPDLGFKVDDFGDNLEEGRTILYVTQYDESTLKIYIDFDENEFKDNHVKCSLSLFDDVWLALSAISKNPYTNLRDLNLKKEFTEDFEGEELKRMVLKFQVTSRVGELLNDKDAKIRDYMLEGVEAAVDIILTEYELKDKYTL